MKKRTYLNTRLEFGRHVDLWFKYALSCYPERETISSDLIEIVGIIGRISTCK